MELGQIKAEVTIPNELDVLSNHLEQLDNTLDKLRDKLNGVLAPESPPVSGVGNKNPQECHSAITERIKILNGITSRMLWQLNEMIERIEL